MKAECKDCINCDIKDEAAAKEEFDFPDDYDCILEQVDFPEQAHLCTDFIDCRPFWETD